jgi:hypothetical protein
MAETMTMPAPTIQQRSPVKPFYFNTAANLMRITRYKANTLAEFLDALREVPEDSIFQHSFRTLQEHHFIRQGFSNDFAQWALSSCKEPGLGEKLSAVDIREFTSIAELRTRFVGIMEDFLRVNSEAGNKVAQETFYFCASDVVVIPTHFVARTMHEFAEGIRSVSVHSIHHHFIEARLRIKLMSNDFSQWLHEDMGLTATARALNQIDIYTGTLEDVRSQIVRIVERALTTGGE